MIRAGDIVYYIGGQDKGGREALDKYDIPQLQADIPYKVLEAKMHTGGYYDGIEKWSLFLEEYKASPYNVFFASFMFTKDIGESLKKP